MQIYAQILVISPVLQPLQRRLDGCVPSTLVGTLALPHPPRKPVPSFSTSFSPLSLSPSPSPSFSLSSCLRCSFQQQRRVLFLSACSRAPCEIAGLRRRLGGRVRLARKERRREMGERL